MNIVEAVYEHLDAEPAIWRGHLRAVAQRSMTGARWMTVADIDVTNDRFETIGLEADDERRAIYTAWHGAAPRSLLDGIYLRGPVSRLAPVISGTPWVEALAGAGVCDVVGAVGLDPSGRGTVVSYGTRERTVSHGRRLLLGRLAAHLAAASRLRASHAPTDFEAICDSSGGVVDATGDARSPDVRAALRDAARRIDRARSRTLRVDDDERVAMWSALVEGRWSLVERFESDGRRLFVARRNEPTGSRRAELSSDQRAVVALAAIGRPVKVIAYELGKSEATVSRSLAKAMRKLGISTRAALVELHGVLLGEP